MAEVAAKDVAALRKVTGAGMMDCKKALQETDGDQEAAVDWLRKQGLGASKRAGRSAEQGTVDVVIDDDVAALVELTCETDFVAKGADFVATVAALARLVADNGDDEPRGPAVRGPDRRRGRDAARRQARREDRARSGRPLRDHRRRARRLQAHPERARARSASWSSSAASTARTRRPRSSPTTWRSTSPAPRRGSCAARTSPTRRSRRSARCSPSSRATRASPRPRSPRSSRAGSTASTRTTCCSSRASSATRRSRSARSSRSLGPECHRPTVHPRQGGRGIGSVWTRTRECR